MSTRGDSTPKFHSTNKRNKPPRKPKSPTVDKIDQARVFGSPTKKGGPPLHCKIAIVIDSGRKDGVSRTVAVTLGQLGAWVAYTYPSDQQRAAAMEIGEEVRNVGGLAFVIRSSPFDLAAAQALVRSVMIHFGVRHIDIIVNNAGWNIALPRPMTLVNIPKRLLDDFEGNLLAAAHMTQAAWSCLAEKGRIIYFESYAGQIPMPSPCHEGSTSGAMQLLAQNWTLRLGTRGATVNIIAHAQAPGKDAMSLEDSKQLWMNAFIDMSRRQSHESRLDEIGQIIARLCKDSGKGITNKVFRVGYE